MTPEEASSCAYMLNERETQLVQLLDRDYAKELGGDPSMDGNLIYFLGDRYEFSRTWSAKSHRVPTYRRNNGLFLHRQTMTFMTGTDKLASLGWPVTPETAKQMLTKVLPNMDSKRSSLIAGNSMHLSNVALVTMVALLCYGPARSQSVVTQLCL